MRNEITEKEKALKKYENFIENFILFLSWKILTIKFKISLIKILKIYPSIPIIGTRKYIIKIVTTRSNILHNMTPTCSFIPFNIPSIILSTYIKNTRGDRSLIQIAVSILPYIVKLNSFAKKKNMVPIPIEKTIAIFKIVLHTFRILLVFLLASNLENSGIIKLLKDIIKTLAKSNIGITIPSYHTIF